MIVQGNSEKIPLKNDSVDLVVTDPPYGLKFMGKSWDKALPKKKIWKEIFRVMKPGAFAFIHCSSRQDLLCRLLLKLELVGFRTDFTSMLWCYAKGFPKAQNLGKLDESLQGAFAGFQPKPAQEPILVIAKPLSEKTYLKQALKNGKGCTWLDDCRVPSKGRPLRKQIINRNDLNRTSFSDLKTSGMSIGTTTQGRYPANLLVSDDALNDGTNHKSGSRQSLDGPRSEQATSFLSRTGKRIGDYDKSEGSFSRYFDLDAWAKEKLPEQVLKTYPYLIVPKPGPSEKNHGLKNKPKKRKSTLGNFKDNPGRTTPKTSDTPRANFHPTVKALKLEAYLIMLGSRKGDFVLDPFVGSGTTGIAASILKRNFLGIELNREYADIAKHREHAWSK